MAVDDLSAAFFQPCMRGGEHAIGVQLAISRQSALLSWTDALPRLALEDGLKTFS